MTHTKRSIVACCLVVLAGVLAGPLTGASASKQSIKAAIKSYSGPIAVAEGHTLTALGEYKSTHVPAPVEEAITKSVTVLAALRSKISHQGAVRCEGQAGRGQAPGRRRGDRGLRKTEDRLQLENEQPGSGSDGSRKGARGGQERQARSSTKRSGCLGRFRASAPRAPPAARRCARAAGGVGAVEDAVVAHERERSACCATASSPSRATARGSTAPTARIATCGGLMIALKSLTPNMPRLDTVNVPPPSSGGVIEPSRTRSASVRVSRAISPSDLASASNTVGTTSAPSAADRHADVDARVQLQAAVAVAAVRARMLAQRQRAGLHDHVVVWVGVPAALLAAPTAA